MMKRRRFHISSPKRFVGWLHLRCELTIALLPIAAVAQPVLHPGYHEAAHQAAGTIVVPASDFFRNIPAGDTNDGRLPAAFWFFNNSTINLGAKDDVTANVPIPEAGTYHLYVRSVGSASSGFKVEINGHTDAKTYGNAPLHTERGGDFTLAKGTAEIKLTAIAPRPSVNVLVLTKRDALTDDDLKPLELAPEVKLLHEYKIAPSNIVKFGDVDGS